MRIGPDGLAEPWAAESVTWEDDTNVVVKLREGMLWHDGEPVTADDLIFSFQAPAGEEAPMYKPFVSRIANIEKVDDLTVRFTLTEPWVAFETASLAKLNLIPKHIWEPILAELADSPDNAESIEEDDHRVRPLSLRGLVGSGSTHPGTQPGSLGRTQSRALDHPRHPQPGVGPGPDCAPAN